LINAIEFSVQTAAVMCKPYVQSAVMRYVSAIALQLFNCVLGKCSIVVLDKGQGQICLAL